MALKVMQRMFKTVTIFAKIFKSLILQILWICHFCGFMSYLTFWLYFGCMCAMKADVDKLDNPVWSKPILL
jgi:hypothetical protein